MALMESKFLILFNESIIAFVAIYDLLCSKGIFSSHIKLVYLHIYLTYILHYKIYASQIIMLVKIFLLFFFLF